MARTGRRRGGDARAAIAAAASRQFAEVGYEKATLRRIADDARCDPALILHYFGSKEALFVEVMELPARPSQVLAGVVAGPKRSLGRRLVASVLAVWEADGGGAVAGLLRSAAGNDVALRMLRELFTREIMRPLAAHMSKAGTGDARLRADLVASQMLGLAMARYVLKLEPLASLDTDAVVDAVAPTIQRYLTA